jgi:hypothetical protein
MLVSNININDDEWDKKLAIYSITMAHIANEDIRT